LSSIDNQIALLKSRIDAARLADARAQATRETAQASESAAMDKLRSEFGVDNLTDARAKLVELQTDLQSKLDEISSVLDDIEI
jgi:predicted  nucleic acid-binding Zn-ribbon protein